MTNCIQCRCNDSFRSHRKIVWCFPQTHMHYRGSRGSLSKAPVSDKPRQRKRKKRRRLEIYSLAGHWCTAIACCCGIPLLFGSLAYIYDIRQRGHRLKHKSLYDQINSLSSSKRSTLRKIESRKKDANHSSMDYQQLVSDSYGPKVLGCPISALFLDPRSFPPGAPAWFALESLAYALPEACVVLLGNVTAPIFALPMFQAMIERGQVRRSQLQVSKYNMKLPFTNPSKLLMNGSFWRDEFLDIDSDHVMFIQDDSVFCQPSVFDRLKEQYFQYAFVGAPWPATANPMLPFPPEGMCVGMPIRWRSWLLPQRQWKRGKRSKPKLILNETLVACDGRGNGPVGNGGFSLRSVSWMLRAIEVCHGVDAPCRVLEDLNEDFYFATVLRGLGAPLPNAKVAALFSVESMWPEEAMSMYGRPYDNMLEPNIADAQLFRYEKTDFTVPIGVHKPYWYNPSHLLDALTPQCPFLEFIFAPNMSRWADFRATKTDNAWKGIGT